MVIDDLSKFHLLSDDMKKQMTKGARNTVNIMAAKARKEIIKQVPQNLHDRYGFVAKQARFTPMAEGFHPIDEIKATVGFTPRADFMERQEEGGEHKAKKVSLRIYTDAAREGEVRPGKVQRGYGYKKNTRHMIIRYLHTKGKKKGTTIQYGKNKAQASIIKTYYAFKSGLLMWGEGNDRALYKVVKFKNRKGGGFEAESKMIINFRHSRTYTKGKHFFQPACEKAAKDGQRIFISEMAKLGM
jgi:hypothetical protein